MFVGPIAKPTQAFRRTFYETGRDASTPNVGGNLIASANAFEASSVVMSSPGFLVSLEAAISSAAIAGNLYLLAYDLQPTTANVNAVVGGTAGAARYSWGPLTAGGTFAREFSEPFPPQAGGDERVPFMTGAPFDQGCIIVASTTPVVFTAGAGASTYHLLARIAQGGC